MIIMDIKTKSFIKERLREYYDKKGVIAPTQIERREFGFGDIKKIDYRHISFQNEVEMKRHFVENVPLYASFSVGYYEFPAGRPMEKKQFISSDLIFEFDNECSETCSIACEKCLGNTMTNTIKLIEDFLIPDFGFKKEEIKVSFSGNRGYHIYVVNNAVKQLNSIARREIVDYIQGSNFDFDKLVKKKTTAIGGWRKRFTKSALNFVKEKSNLKKFKDSEFVEKQILEGNFDLLRSASTKWQEIMEKDKIIFGNDIDKSVTIDISRLIRLPSTIHGGSSLLCEYVPDLNNYNPFRNAVVFGNNPVKLKINADISEFVLKEQTFGPFQKDEIKELPEFVAMFLTCKAKAEIV